MNRRLTMIAMVILALATLPLRAQLGTGAVFNPHQKQYFRKFSSLGYGTETPASYSLHAYTPYPKNQGQYGTCAAWSSIYDALTTAYAKQMNFTDRNTITGLAFDPFFVYNQVSVDNSCQEGIGIPDILLFMMDNGVKKFYLPALGCGSAITDDLKQDALGYKLYDAFVLYQIPAELPCDFTDYEVGVSCYFQNKNALNVDDIKKTIANGTPVIFSMFVPNSFFNTVTDYWESTSDEKLNPAEAVNAHKGLHQQHAMTIVAYDDNKYGGAFEIMNSWGQSWGNKGFTWVKYDELKFWMYEAYTFQLQPVTATSNTGCTNGDCGSGYGSYKFDNGGRYEGHFKNGQYDGYGIYTWADGNVYAGQWKDGKRDGDGVQYFPNGDYGISYYANDVQTAGFSEWDYDGGDKYFGNIAKGNMYREGYGIYKWMDGKSYEGGWTNNNREGLGMMDYGNGDKYIGEWSDDGRNGIGVYISSDGSIQAGKWSYGSFKEGHSGAGYADDQKIKNMKSNNVSTRFTPRNYATADCQTGDCLGGQGTRRYSDGTNYIGEFKDGVEDGYGKMTYGDGSSYTGHFRQGNPDGVGRWEYANGTRIIVNYVNGLIEGYVLQYDNSGYFLVQYYEGGAYVRDVTSSMTITATATKGIEKFGSNPKNNKKVQAPKK